MTIKHASTSPDDLARLVLEALEARIRNVSRPFLLGLSGLQGSGKSTLAQALIRLARTRGLPAQTLSLDDVYLSRRERRLRAAQIHPLLRTRGVPGTHDLDLLSRTLDALAYASATHPVALPRFDKGHDTRRPPSRWPRVTESPRLIVLEGWCVGVPSQPGHALVQPINRLEQDEDPDGLWRNHVNNVLRAMQPLWKRMDALVLLAAPDWNTACHWRAQAEQDLRQRDAPQSMNSEQLRRFMQHFERLSRHALHTLPQRCDLQVNLDTAHHAQLVDHL